MQVPGPSEPSLVQAPVYFGEVWAGASQTHKHPRLSLVLKTGCKYTCPYRELSDPIAVYVTMYLQMAVCVTGCMFYTPLYSTFKCRFIGLQIYRSTVNITILSNSCVHITNLSMVLDVQAGMLLVQLSLNSWMNIWWVFFSLLGWKELCICLLNVSFEIFIQIYAKVPAHKIGIY